jgi:hypothetical protein
VVKTQIRYADFFSIDFQRAPFAAPKTSTLEIRSLYWTTKTRTRGEFAVEDFGFVSCRHPAGSLAPMKLSSNSIAGVDTRARRGGPCTEFSLVQIFSIFYRPGILCRAEDSPKM